MANGGYGPGQWVGGGHSTPLMGGGDGGMPKPPEMGQFQPYQMQYDPSAMLGLLAAQRPELLTGIYERAAGEGKGRGFKVQSELNLAGRESQMLSQDYMRHMQQQQQLTMQSYLAYIEQKYGLQSTEYQAALTEYGRQQAEPSAWEKALGAIGGGIGTAAGLGWNPLG